MWGRSLLCGAGAVVLGLLSPGASAVTWFGSALDHQLTPAELCNATKKGDLCSWVLTHGRNPGHEQAPRDGTINKIRLMSCTAGTFIVQLARALPSKHKARVIRTGPLINYLGDPANCRRSSNFIIEEFPVDIPVHLGDYLAVVASKVGFIYSSGSREDVFDPPLPDGGPVVQTNNTGLGSGITMIQAILAE
jgi:hypothetical protein